MDVLLDHPAATHMQIYRLTNWDICSIIDTYWNTNKEADMNIYEMCDRDVFDLLSEDDQN
jgi:hypothetical protein